MCISSKKKHHLSHHIFVAPKQALNCMLHDPDSHWLACCDPCGQDGSSSYCCCTQGVWPQSLWHHHCACHSPEVRCFPPLMISGRCKIQFMIHQRTLAIADTIKLVLHSNFMWNTDKFLVISVLNPEKKSQINSSNLQLKWTT